MGFKEAIKKKIQSEIEPIVKTINFFKKLFNKLIDLCFGWIIRLAPKPWSRWWLSRPRKHRWIISIFSLGALFNGPTHFSENGYTCDSIYSFLLSPFIIASLFYSFLFAKNHYAEWAWPETVREEMKVFVELDVSKDGKWSSFFKNLKYVTPWQVDGLGRPIMWTCGDLMWKRIWNSMWIALGITCFGWAIILLPFLALIDKIIPAAQCFPK